MSHHLGIPLARARLNSEQESVEENWSEFSQWEIGEMYAPRHFPHCQHHVTKQSLSLFKSKIFAKKSRFLENNLALRIKCNKLLHSCSSLGLPFELGNQRN